MEYQCCQRTFQLNVTNHVCDVIHVNTGRRSIYMFLEHVECGLTFGVLHVITIHVIILINTSPLII